jgi:lipoprotein-anchoring transpeptidase ErfK/SrfK
MILVLYAFGGWNDAAFVAADLKDRRNIPKALLLGTLGITLSPHRARGVRHTGAQDRGERALPVAIQSSRESAGRGAGRRMRRGAQPLFRRAPMKIEIDTARQELRLPDGTRYAVSTAKNGLGEQNGSFCTPRGRHIVRARIGAGQPLGAVFVRRRPTGEVWSPELHAKYPGRDWMLTRILWLSGCEVGKNRLGDVDTMRRMIYIHGAPDSAEMGKPGSHGCIRMRNRDVAELFELAPPYAEVEIKG